MGNTAGGLWCCVLQTFQLMKRCGSSFQATKNLVLRDQALLAFVAVGRALCAHVCETRGMATPTPTLIFSRSQMTITSKDHAHCVHSEIQAYRQQCQTRRPLAYDVQFPPATGALAK
jgi:hypothetical protein